ncbi:sodium channel protein para-like [Tigriopus californicus]|uniref:sodium channel protein para-like n=1 Tax=Tigriopus californicus TaxID=6832 RepID=UPI0027DA9A0F|nr:sodium channel protein para-like [Tigriopus californicus]
MGTFHFNGSVISYVLSSFFKGNDLPRRYGEFPLELANLPICDIDPYYRDTRTFMVVSKGGAIYRFSAGNALFFLSPFHPIRRIALLVLTHPMFSFFIICTILVNCFVMVQEDSEELASVEIIFTAIYTYESAIKLFARGLVMDKFTYLRDAWNWLDFIVIAMSYVTIAIDLGSFSALRTFRVFRAMKSVAVIPGLKTIVSAIMYSVKNLRDVIVLTIFVLAVFALLGLQIYMGVLSQICVKDFFTDSEFVNKTGNIDLDYELWTNNASNWFASPSTGQLVMCGNSSGAGNCPDGFTCLKGGPNPNYGYTSFDNFGSAYLCAFRLMTQDYWENLYQITLRTAGPWNIFFFMVNIFLGSFYLINLILAIVAMSYDELQRQAEEEARKEMEELEAIQCAEEAAMTEAEAAAAEAVANLSLLDFGGGSLGSGEFNHGFEGDSFHEQDAVVLKDVVNQMSITSSMKSLSVYMDDNDEEEEGPNCKEAFKTNLEYVISILCIWDCGIVWIKMSEILAIIVFDPFMELFIILCIVVNVLFMTLDHYNIDYHHNGGMSPFFTSLLNNGNYFFTAIFAIESFAKLGAMSPRYFFTDGWNIFDFVIVILSFVELLAEGISGLSMLRSFRLLRVFKLAKSWKSLNDILSIMANTFGALSYLTFVLGIIIFIFAVMGMQLFGSYYVTKVCNPKWNCVMPRWNFTDFMHSIMIVFRVLCGEWIESMWDCMFVAGVTCVPYFLATVLVANLVILNLFLALLLSSFSDMGGGEKAEDQEKDKIQIAFDRIGWFFTCQMCRSPKGKDKEDEPPPPETPSDLDGMSKKDSIIGNGIDLSYSKGALSTAYEEAPGYDKFSETIDYSPADEILVEDCCPQIVYKIFPCCHGNPEEPFWQVWSKHRLMGSQLIENKYFEGIVLVLILVSSFVMTLEDIWFDTKPLLIDTLYYLDRILTGVFFIETSLKLFSMGFIKYFGNAWCWLDFVIVAVSLINFGASLLGAGNIPIFKTMRTLRALRPLRAMAKLEGMKVVVNALIGALPSIFNVLLVCLIFWLIFAIIGVNFFMGRFYKCIDPNTGVRFSHEVIPNMTMCNSSITGFPAEWVNSRVTFDNVGMAYLALLQVATWKGWIDIMNDAIDSVDRGKQPHREVNIYMYIYFVLFIVLGSFFTLNLLVGVIIDKFNEQKNKGGSSLDAFMTEDQRKYIAAMKKASTKKPLKALPRPFWKPQAIVFGIVTNKKFDMIIMGFIALNMVAMMCDHYDQSPNWTFVLDNMNMFFIVVFTTEMLLKLFALRHHYFSEPWNLFDFVVVLLSLAGLFLSDLIAKYFVSPTLLRVVRVAKIGRVLRLIKGARGIRTLLFSLVMAFPALINIALLLFLVMFIFSVFGMSLFKNVKITTGFDDVHNFQTFTKTFTLLFQICTSAGWAEAWLAISNEKNCTEPDPETGSSGNCGSNIAAVIFMILYLVLTFLIIVNMYIAVILENYSQASEDVQEGITDEDYELFYEVWREFDPEGTQYMPFKNLSEFLDVLEPPLQIRKPNKFKIVQMDIPIVRFINPETGQTREDCVFCADILDILTQDFFARKGNKIEESPHVEHVKVTTFADRPGYERVSSSVWKQRESYCASLIQRSFKYHASLQS